ncbi:MAG: hypothetical protein CO013_04095 [Syntrophobacterales bacterium CG_4_8_14_3_um_filter_58_8]|nr:MAG: hypothetical protein AUK26_06925 [Syntrophaceae bacterium CG2_30_58_14]PIV02444.1 MAG: hypothetical protein COS57_12260 [Syntrophobacterales bacterium CG03_land_8_20_14_0_80_58_14]PJC74601.1 MAG: hypothetical protein CO013_04095 [Syntrophobacterales bacterium CG_4_8_14_3_um_filter_58_8]
MKIPVLEKIVSGIFSPGDTNGIMYRPDRLEAFLGHRSATLHEIVWPVKKKGKRKGILHVLFPLIPVS